jgi:quercetin dioxygenase-like cupin family protein
MRARWTWLVLIATMTAVAQAQDARAPAPSSDLAASRVFDVDSLAATHNANGSERRDVVRSGRLATGEAVHIHASMQPSGTQPGPAHTIQHSEFILVTEGTLEVSLDGKTSRAGPGSIVYVAHGTLHQARNVGPGPVKYTVVAIGGDAK